MLCSRFLKPPSEHHNALYMASERALDGARDAYGWMLRGVMRHRPITMLVALGTLVGTVYLLAITPKGFIPSQDTGSLQGSTEAGQDIPSTRCNNCRARLRPSWPRIRISRCSARLWGWRHAEFAHEPGAFSLSN